ncbi:DUF6461 domain-containing protein [Umezawaea sp. NPDC059074]|uniref:DUF6461 domain-containing protein n=1 Tax=Umezawaea sp. NPDC059074 TaxID=3346716 RepID=UPI0036A23195
MDHDIARAIPSVLRHLPPASAAELGRIAGTRPARTSRHGSAVSSAFRGLSGTDLAAVVRSAVDAVDVTASPDLVGHLVARQGEFGFLASGTESAESLAVRLLDVCHPGATDLVVEHVFRLVHDSAIAPLLAVGPEHTDEADIAGLHGAAHLALCAATAAALLRALDTDFARAAIVGTALGAAALLLRDRPMPAGYAAALRAKRRAEFAYPAWTPSANPTVRDHLFALADGPVPDTADFSANGLVAVVPGGVLVRTGIAEGHVPVSLSLVAEPWPETDLTGWDEVVEVSWHAEVGDARIGGQVVTPPWPGDLRVLVLATGRDDGVDEGYSVRVWPAPAAETVVGKLTDRLGHRLRGEPEPPVVVPPEKDHWWVEKSVFQVAVTVTAVVGLSAEEVLEVFGVDAETGSMAEARVGEINQWIAVSEADGVVVVFEDSGFAATRDEVLQRLSRNGKAASAYWNVNAGTRLSFARDGEVLASFEPGPCPSDDPEVRAAFDPFDFVDRRHRDAKMVAAVARFTGRTITEADFDAVEVAHFTAE